MTWVETHSASFEARHEAADADDVAAVLDRLEHFRADLARWFSETPGDVTVVIHGSPFMLALAHPWLELARLAASPASRRYFGGWFTHGEMHVLSPRLLENRASNVPGSAQALALAPEHEYAHLLIGMTNNRLPPPFTPGTFRFYLAWAWLCEGGATWLAGQTPHLAPAIATRLREGPAPAFPPSRRDAMLLGGSVFDLLEAEHGPEACVALMRRLVPDGPEVAIERVFGRPPSEVERDWRGHLDEITAAKASTGLERELPDPGPPTARASSR